MLTQLTSAPGLLVHILTAKVRWRLFSRSCSLLFYSKWFLLLIQRTPLCHHLFWGHVKGIYTKKRLHSSPYPHWYTTAGAPYPGRVADMLSKMHLHCCRRWSFHIRAVPSRLPLTNLRQGGNKQLAPSLYTLLTALSQRSNYEKSMVSKYNDFPVPFTWVAKLDAVDFVLHREQRHGEWSLYFLCNCKCVICSLICNMLHNKVWLLRGFSPCAHGAPISFLDSRFPGNIFGWHHQYFLLLRTSHLETNVFKIRLKCFNPKFWEVNFYVCNY